MYARGTWTRDTRHTRPNLDGNIPETSAAVSGRPSSVDAFRVCHLCANGARTKRYEWKDTNVSQICMICIRTSYEFCENRSGDASSLVSPYTSKIVVAWSLYRLVGSAAVLSLVCGQRRNNAQYIRRGIHSAPTWELDWIMWYIPTRTSSGITKVGTTNTKNDTVRNRAPTCTIIVPCARAFCNRSF